MGGIAANDFKRLLAYAYFCSMLVYLLQNILKPYKDGHAPRC